MNITLFLADYHTGAVLYQLHSGNHFRVLLEATKGAGSHSSYRSDRLLKQDRCNRRQMPN